MGARRCTALAIVIALVFSLLGAVDARADGPSIDETHPHLLFGPADVAGYRARFAAGGVPGQAAQRVREKAEGHLLKVHPDVLRAGEDVDPINVTQRMERPYNLQNELPTYLIELGFAYQMSGDTPAERDPRFGRRAIDLLLAVADEGYPFWSGQDLGIGDLNAGMALAFDWTYELMTDAERSEIVGDLVASEQLLFRRPLLEPTNAWANNLESSNWMGVTTGGTGMLLLTLRGLPGVPASWYTIDPDDGTVSYWEKTLERIDSFLHRAVDPNGAYEEGLTYAVYGMKNAIPFVKAVERAGWGNRVEGTGLPLLSRWMAFEQLPGEGQNFVPLNDSQRTMFGVDLPSQLFAINPNDGVAQWLWQRTVGPQGDDYYREPHVPYVVREDKCDRPLELSSTAACDIYQFHGNVWAALWYRTPDETPEVDPSTTGALTVHHAQRGLVDARTGFDGGRAEVVSTFEARRDGRAHYQYDLGGFTLYGNGGQFAIDPGYSCVACKKPRAQMNAAERAQDEDGAYATYHNVIVIDDDTYTQHHDSRWNLLGDWADHDDDLESIDAFVDAPNLSLAHADLRYAYNFASPIAGRDHLFSRTPGRPVLLGITDHVQRDDSPHRYRWQLLTGPGNLVSVDGPTFTITAPNGATLVGRIAAAGSSPVMQTDARVLLNPTDDRGKVAPVVFSETPAQLALEQVAFMALTPPGAEPATTETIDVAGGSAVAVTWNGITDVFARRSFDADVVTGAIETDGRVAKVTVDHGETVLRAGTTLVVHGRPYITVRGTPATVTVSGDAIAAIGDAGNEYRVLAPQAITSVTVNGEPAASCRTGKSIVFPCTHGRG